MRIKFLFFAIFASLFAGLIYSSKVYANTQPSPPEGIYTRPIPICENYPDFLSVMKNDLNVTVDDKTSYVGFIDSGNWQRYAFSDFQPTSSRPQAPIRIADNGTDYILYINNSTTYRYPKSNQGVSNYSNGSLYRLKCISANQNIVFGYEIPGRSNFYKLNPDEYSKYSAIKEFTKTTPNYDGRCSVIDVGCWVRQGLVNIGNSISEMFEGIVKLFENILEFFGNLFIPNDQNLFLNTFNDLNDNMRKKLGFLTFPFDFLGKLYQSISFSADYMYERHCYWGRKAPYSDPTNWTGIPTCPEICAEKILGDASICINFGELERRMPEIWAVGINILRFGVLISLIEILRRKYLSVVRG